MTTRIAGPLTGASASTSASRGTAPPGQPFKAVMSRGAGAVLSGAEQVTRLPGGPLLAAERRPAAGAGSAAYVGSGSVRQSLCFVEIQARRSAESRSGSALSNALKARHDTLKNAIGNSR